MIHERLTALRELMRRESIDAFIFPSTDPHNGEYVPDHWKCREWISGFNGSAGTAVVTLHEAALWTDSRYFLAAEEQLKGTEYALMRERIPETPSIKEWLARKLAASGGTCVGIDGTTMTAAEMEDYIAYFRRSGITVRHNLDPLQAIWTDRPSVPQDPIIVHPLEFAGESVQSKLARVRNNIKELRYEWHLVTMLDDVAWTLNLRGSDVHCTPVFVAYLLIGMKEAMLFVDERKVTDDVRRHLAENGVKIKPYGDVRKVVKGLGSPVLMDKNTTCYSLFTASETPINGRTGEEQSPIPAMKIMKNDAEIRGYRSAMLKDGVAMVKFLRWLDEAPLQLPTSGGVSNSPFTEVSVDETLTAFRAEQPGFRGLSFDTIAGYEAHGAIVHYEATPETDIPLAPKGLLLLDSGAQFAEGTTDITRTIPLGPLTDEQRLVYTLILKGHIELAMAKFPDGASGTQIDAFARQFIWQHGMNYMHGTGHGVGSYLSVHEGPHQIRMEWKPQKLHAGMTVTNEPGLYVAGKFGVRIENTMLITEYKETEFGKFLQLEPLTLCPISTRPVLLELMTKEELHWLNAYHKRVREELLPLLTDEKDRQWLIENTNTL